MHDEQENRRDLPEQTGEEKKPVSVKEAQAQKRRIFIWVIAGGYLLYLAYQLISGVARGTVTDGGQKTVSIAAGVLFAVVAVFLLISSVRQGLRSFRDSVDAMVEAEEAEEAEALPAADEAEPPAAETESQRGENSDERET